ncbi:tyrosine-type recombinase/integrase [Sulfurimonas sp.]|uniref:tyrosine-type recombinase/integrase n=1 Tax=Sulfurimonas sp. TaxID=2022749 RepID=UPI00261B18B4|nr:tyrosine-type recombinase/integrase [Sulfurimonas sp.]MDD5157300.1 tyrosine-type recombinase/integrase [Sulfurimonas sp.]
MKTDSTTMKKQINNQIKEFLKYLEEIRGYSDLTIKSYDETLKEAFLNHKESEAAKNIEIFQEDKNRIFNLMPYRIKIASLNSKTISKKLSAIRSFAKYLNDKGERVVVRADDSIKVAKTLPKPISHKIITEALLLAEPFERLIVTMFYALGVRISELASLETKDLSQGWIRVFGKGSKQRDMPLLPMLEEMLNDYLSLSKQKKFIFEKNGEKLSENSLRYIVIKVFKRVNIKVSPHQLRHSYATELLNNNAPIADVSELLGHSSMATTQIYTKLGSALKQKNYDKAHPLCGADK